MESRRLLPDVPQPSFPTVLPGRLMDYIRRRGGDPAPLLPRFGLPFAADHHPFLVLPVSTIVAFCEAAEEVSEDPFVGLHAAEQGPSELLKVLAFACSGVSTVEDALERYVKYLGMIHDTLTTSLHPTAAGAALRLKLPGHPTCLGRHGNEHWAATLMSFARHMVVGDVTPERVWLAHPAPRRQDELIRVLGTTHLTFDAGYDAIELSRQTLALPVRSVESSLSAVLHRFAERAPSPPSPVSDFHLRVRSAIEDRLPLGVPSVHDIARALGMSQRTLQRRLTEDGLTFKGVIDAVRRDLALPHVHRGELPLAEIASRAGYAQQSAFFRSFRRWTGTTPAQARRAPAGQCEA